MSCMLRCFIAVLLNMHARMRAVYMHSCFSTAVVRYTPAFYYRHSTVAVATLGTLQSTHIWHLRAYWLVRVTPLY
jgi:hypothetical protein